MKEENKKSCLYVLIEGSVLLDTRLTYSAQILYACICYSANNSKGYCYRDNKSLMSMMNLSEKQFYRNIKKLLEFNYVEVIEVDNQKFYMPTVNKIFIEAKKKRKQLEEKIKEVELLDYNWLEERN